MYKKVEKTKKEGNKKWQNKCSLGGGQNLQSNLLTRNIKEFNVIILILIATLIIGIAGATSLALFSGEANSNNVISGVVVKNNKTLDKSGANPPLLAENMIPVYYDTTNNTWKKADVNNKDENYKWYDYDNKMWANAVTVSTYKRSEYLQSDPGTEISMDYINAMFVWIPRYKYTYFSSSTPLEIQIAFENDTETTGTITCKDNIQYSGTAWSGNTSEKCTDKVNGSLVAGTSTYTHPAFTFGSNKLTGIWMGKFELDRDIEMKPGELSLYDVSVSGFFKYSRKMELANNIYGFPQTGSTLENSGKITSDSNNLDTHMIKNTEWGATAYLSHSKYGTCTNGVCKEIGINNYSFGSRDAAMTGFGAEAGSNGTTSDLNKYNTTEGMKASTTRNIYGVYDMSGGWYEYTMGVMYTEENTFQHGSSQNSWFEYPLEKYYDKYTYGTDRTRAKLGDGVLETDPSYGNNNWYGDNAYFRSVSDVWFIRGGYINSQSSAGLFTFYTDEGGMEDIHGSRAGLIITS